MKTILFDFDGTIADTLPIGVELVNKNADKYHYPKITTEEVERFRGMQVLDILKELRISIWKVTRVGKTIKQELNGEIGRVEIFPGLKEVIFALKNDGYRLGIVTLNIEKNIEQFLKNNGIEVFDFVYSVDKLFGKGKVIKESIKKEDLKPEETVYIGDEVRDIEAAKKAGIKAVSVTWGYNNKEILSRFNEKLVDKPDQLVSKVSEIFQNR